MHWYSRPMTDIKHVHVFHGCNLDDLDPGVRRTVRWLRLLGYFTVDSGDGTSKPEEEREFNYPHVLIMERREHLLDRCDALGKVLDGLGIPEIMWHQPNCTPFPVSPSSSVSYEAGGEFGVIMVSHVHDGNLPAGLGEGDGVEPEAPLEPKHDEHEGEHEEGEHDESWPTDPVYLRDLADRILTIPATYDVDQGDVEHLRELADRIEGTAP